MLPETDVRHGTSAGYIAGCRDECCRIPRMRQQKATRLRVHRGLPTYYTAEQVQAAVKPWRHLGFSSAAILEAAGLNNDHAFNGSAVLVSTYTKLITITEGDFADNKTVWSDLTKRRIFSLMAAGHQLSDMPINSKGAWRDRDRTRVGIARAIRDYYAANEFKIGGHTQTATRARNAGHKPPMSWDDPGTLAWPLNMTKMEKVPKVPISKDIDPIVVERVLAGDMPEYTTKAEKLEITRRWLADGRSLRSLEIATGWRSGRYGKVGAA